MRVSVVALLLAGVASFAPPRRVLVAPSARAPGRLTRAASEGEAADGDGAPTAAVDGGAATADDDLKEPMASAEQSKLELLSKMSGWESTMEERKAATLGGMTPGAMDGFDVGLYVAFPFLFFPLVAFLFFPAIANNFLDINSVGPPPTS